MNRKNNHSLIAVLFLISILSRSFALNAGGIEVPTDSLAKLLLKIISMETGLTTRVGDAKVTIGLIGSDAVRDFTGSLAAELEKNHSAKLLEKDYELKLFAPEDSVKALTECHVVFVADTGSMKPSEIAAAGEGKPVIVFAREPVWVEEGLMIGVFLEDQKPKIMLNLAVVRKAGLEFKNQLLKISKVLK